MSALKTLMVAAAIALSPAVAVAQPHGHAHREGAVEKIGQYEAELDVKGTDLTLQLRDAADKDVPSQDFRATAVVLAKDGQKTVAMRPAGGNKLSGKIDFPYSGKFRATVTLSGPSGEIGKGRFNFDPAK